MRFILVGETGLYLMCSVCTRKLTEERDGRHISISDFYVAGKFVYCCPCFGRYRPANCVRVRGGEDVTEMVDNLRGTGDPQTNI